MNTPSPCMLVVIAAATLVSGCNSIRGSAGLAVSPQDVGVFAEAAPTLRVLDRPADDPSGIRATYAVGPALRMQVGPDHHAVASGVMACAAASWSVEFCGRVWLMETGARSQTSTTRFASPMLTVDVMPWQFGEPSTPSRVGMSAGVELKTPALGGVAPMTVSGAVAFTVTQ